MRENRIDCTFSLKLLLLFLIPSIMNDVICVLKIRIKEESSKKKDEKYTCRIFFFEIV